MNDIIHVLNGDNTARIFKKSLLQGTVVIWREMLCEGLLTIDVGSDPFWKKRYTFFESELGISKLDYYDRTIKEIIALENTPKNATIVLWFEYDLFCQINMLAACTYLLKNFRKDLSYYLVCPGKGFKNDQLQLFSHFSPAEFTALFDKKVKLTKQNLIYAAACWEVYVKNDFDEISQFDFDKSPKFQFLQQAMNQHLQRFPMVNGLNQIEQEIINTIYSGRFTKKEIVKKMLLWQETHTVYGFGDLLYLMYLDKLNNYYILFEDICELTKVGKSMLQE